MTTAPDLTIVTITCDQPIGFALCEAYVARQTWPIDRVQWIVVDDGETPIVPTLGQEHIRRSRAGCSGVESFGRNLLAALPLIRHPYVAFCEHDDHYAPTHLERVVTDMLRRRSLIGGDDQQRYYNVGTRQWRIFTNHGACLCQTVMSRALLPLFERTVRSCLAKATYGVDTNFWRSVPRERWALARRETVVGIKGLPGRAGLGVGHRPNATWTADHDLTLLRRWIGDNDAQRYAPFWTAAHASA